MEDFANIYIYTCVEAICSLHWKSNIVNTMAQWTNLYQNKKGLIGWCDFEVDFVGGSRDHVAGSHDLVGLNNLCSGQV